MTGLLTQVDTKLLNLYGACGYPDPSCLLHCFASSVVFLGVLYYHEEGNTDVDGDLIFDLGQEQELDSNGVLTELLAVYQGVCVSLCLSVCVSV